MAYLVERSDLDILSLYVSLCPCSAREITLYRAACFDFFNVDDFPAVNIITKYFNSRASGVVSHTALSAQLGETESETSVHSISRVWLTNAPAADSTPLSFQSQPLQKWQKD